MSISSSSGQVNRNLRTHAPRDASFNERQSTLNRPTSPSYDREEGRTVPLTRPTEKVIEEQEPSIVRPQGRSPCSTIDSSNIPHCCAALLSGQVSFDDLLNPALFANAAVTHKKTTLRLARLMPYQVNLLPLICGVIAVRATLLAICQRPKSPSADTLYAPFRGECGIRWFCLEGTSR